MGRKKIEKNSEKEERELIENILNRINIISTSNIKLTENQKEDSLKRVDIISTNTT